MADTHARKLFIGASLEILTKPSLIVEGLKIAVSIPNRNCIRLATILRPRISPELQTVGTLWNIAGSHLDS
jgi:hypothetical protein